MNETEKQTAANPDNAPIIEVNSMHKWYGDFHVLSDINLKVKLGERIVICGPSGSGKSTLIRCINRLEEHQRGQIIVNGTELTNDIKNIEKVRAEVGMVFQHFNLFPHLTILENLTLGPIWVRKTPKKEADEMAMMYLEKLQLARSERLAVLQTTFPAVHWAALVLLGVSLILGFLLACDQQTLLFLAPVQLRLLFSVLVGSLSATACICIDLNDPFTGAFQITPSSEQIAIIREVIEQSLACDERAEQEQRAMQKQRARQASSAADLPR